MQYYVDRLFANKKFYHKKLDNKKASINDTGFFDRTILN
ncbi:MAG: hypothetical protein ACI9LG_003444 [Moritella dasanensis]|jgi:hypothetical protein